MDRHIIDTMENSADYCAEMIESRYENDMLMLDSLAMQLSLSFDDNPEFAVERMSTFAEHYGMKRVAFSLFLILPEDATISSQNRRNISLYASSTSEKDSDHLLSGRFPDFTKIIRDDATFSGGYSLISSNVHLAVSSMPIYRSKGCVLLTR